MAGAAGVAVVAGWLADDTAKQRCRMSKINNEFLDVWLTTAAHDCSDPKTLLLHHAIAIYMSASRDLTMLNP